MRHYALKANIGGDKKTSLHYYAEKITETIEVHDI
jgi:hypothetical protein